MGRPVHQNITTTGVGTWVNLDWMQVPFNVMVSVSLVAPATATFTVEYTDDDLNDPGVTAVVYPDPIVASVSTSARNQLSRPTRFCRINVASLTLSTGTLQFNVIQGMSSR